MKYTSCVVELLPWLLVVAGTINAAVFTEQQTTRVQDFIQTVMRCRKIPGLSIAIVRGEERWTEGYGVADLSSGRAVTSSTLLGVGSITKAFTVSMLAMLLNESASFTWDTPLAAILGPQFQLADDYVTSHVTLTDLLTHRTGLAASSWLFFTGIPHSMSLALFERRLRYLPVSAPFRDGFVYNSWMYCLAGRVAEVLGGASWEELLRMRFLQPMGMKHTFTFNDAFTLQEDEHLASAYMNNGENLVPINTSVYVDIGPFQLAGGMITSADDMTHWMHVLLHGGVTRNGTRILSGESLEDMWRPRVRVPPPDHGLFLYEPRSPVAYTDNGYGLAWFDAQYRGYRVTHHPGSFPGFSSHLALLPDLNLGVFIAANASPHRRALEALVFFILDLLLDLTPWLHPEDACRFPQPWITTLAHTQNSSKISKGQILHGQCGWTDVHAYVGTYGNMFEGDVVISKDGGGGLSLRLNQLVAQLYRTGEDDVLMGKPVGTRHFFSVDGFMKLKFRDPDRDGKFGELLLAYPSDDSEMWSFRRSVRF